MPGALITIEVVYGNVGNTMVAQVLRFMGCDVAALNTVHFSNHTGYAQVRGTKSTAEEISALYEGLRLNRLTDFDVMLSGYAPGASAVNAVGSIAKGLIDAAKGRPGSFFWVLDPVMGDQGKLYVSPDVVPAYKALLPSADLILPNQFELEVLTDTPISSFSDLKKALGQLHSEYSVPHVVVTSVRLAQPLSNGMDTSKQAPLLSVVGSSRAASGAPRAFRIDVPDIDCYFSGTGDMFAALLVARLREAVANVDGLLKIAHWLPDDATRALDLPLCMAVGKVLASMARVLELTKKSRDQELERYTVSQAEAEDDTAATRRQLASTRAAEIRLVRNARWLLDPEMDFTAVEL